MKKLTQEEFIERSIKKHGDIYDYSLVEYINSRTKVKIMCHVHGMFEQTPNSHFRGKGCKKCGYDSIRSNTEQFIQDAWCKHGDVYNYKLVEYINTKTKVIINCSIHGNYKQTPHHHLLGRGCQKCAGFYKEKYSTNDIPAYDTYQYQLEPYGVECRRCFDDENILEVKCMYCGKWYQPSYKPVQSKILAIKGKLTGERNLYCSDNCKQSCPTYNQTKYPKDHGKQGTSREVQPQLRKLVLDRDDYKCVRCGKGIDEVQLHCHHLTGVELNPIESADIDNCITLCKDHHKDVHKDVGCRYTDLKRKEC